MSLSAAPDYYSANISQRKRPLLPPPSMLSSPRQWLTYIDILQGAVKVGCIEIEEGGKVVPFGRPSEGRDNVRISVVDEYFWTRVLLSGNLGFSEAFMMGEVRVDDLQALFIDNLSGLSNISWLYNKTIAAVSGVWNAFAGQTHSRARLNVVASYDLSNDMYKAFLSKEMMYSCGLWGDGEGGVGGDLASGPTAGDLEAAQRRKIQHVLRQLRLQPGHRLLEFGCSTYDCEVDTLTLSIEQKTLAEERIREAGLEARIRVHLLDYRDIPRHFEHAFDALVSIEMIEHVGPKIDDRKYYNTYFRLVDFALKTRNATAVISSSTFPEHRYSEYQAEDFMRRYIWPNSALPSASALIDAANKTTQGRLKLHTVENHSAHYPRTLRTWGRRFKSNVQQDAVAETHPSLRDPMEFAVFARKWEYLFAYAGAGFVKGISAATC
ncbi:cyclopropane-fatty-acyl-phospholipid synthase [Fomitopsis serialis]|uniref:cyclopropane-fatty-acyl-phospholipid synthase n=1 Tax=Fomitopsis serialis TaxID=139415 RepID=UPI0020074BC5|nr:cyclopropane-fatty-acyl-phospholipid synthase [Neoantrodia serialis]KAH9927606.1 cyclopropane-fatty-acyl-phospholipid synthase [Neoantrodia serialis]